MTAPEWWALGAAVAAAAAVLAVLWGVATRTNLGPLGDVLRGVALGLIAVALMVAL